MLCVPDYFPSMEFFLQSLKVTEKAETMQVSLSLLGAYFSFSISRSFLNNDPKLDCQLSGEQRAAVELGYR